MDNGNASGNGNNNDNPSTKRDSEPQSSDSQKAASSEGSEQRDSRTKNIHARFAEGSGVELACSVGDKVQCPNCGTFNTAEMPILTCLHCLTTDSENLPEGFPHELVFPASILFGKRLETYSHWELQRIVMFFYGKAAELQDKIDEASEPRIVTI